MITLFLKAKHWQLFLLMFGAPVIFQMVLMSSLFSSMQGGNQPDMSLFMIGFPLMMFVFAGTFFSWFWSIVIGLQPKVPAVVKMKVTKFKIFFFTPLVYLLFFLAVFIYAFSGAEPNLSIVFVILPIHFFAMFCMFYTLYFVAKTIKTVELQREVSFDDFAGEFFLIWFYPVGIWIIQPKVNKLIEK